MAVDRRRFLATGLAAGAATAAPSSAAEVIRVEHETPFSKVDIPTPALLVDLDRLEANIAKMADHCRQAKVNLRPHAKTHKCPEIARRQLAAGAVGISVATVPEAEALAANGIDGLLLTSPIVEPHKLARVVQLIAAGKRVMLSIGAAREAELLAAAAAAAKVDVDVLIDVDVGDHRTGSAPGEPAVALAKQIAALKSLHVRGVQAYAGSASHTVGFAKRLERSRDLLAGAVDVRQRLDAAGFNTSILSVGSTGTYNIDSQIAGVTELQCGSYCVMDVDYRSIGGRDDDVYADFQPALTVLATVVNDNAAGRVSIDAGTKAIDTTTTHSPESIAPRGLVYKRGGDEFGILSTTESGPLPKLGDRVEFIVPHCDPSIALHDRLYAMRGEKVEAVWPVFARREYPTLMKTLTLAFAVCLSLAGFASAQETKETLQQKAVAVLAQLEGEINLPGLKEPVEVLRDQWGVAHIYAKNDADLFFAQGFVTAQDRLFQIDVWRRVGLGETSELVGEKGLAGDRFARLMKYRGDMDAEWQSYAPDAKQIAESFTRGINAAIDEMGDRLPIEFQILNYKPARWKPEDILGRMSGLVMCGNFLSEASRAQLIDAVGVKAAQILVPTDPVVAFAPLPELDLKGIDRTIFAGYDAAIASLPFEPNKGGSNNWAVDGTRTKSGKPMLAGDPHRAILLPSLRYIVHLNAPGWNVIGAGEPALPGVALGHNDHVAWALTIVNTDQADLYVEQLNPADPTEYRDGDAWKKLAVVRESVVVKGQAAPVEMELQFSKHGPIIHVDKERNRAFALRWVGFEPGAAAYLPSLRLDRVKNAREFVKELDHWKIPALNMTHADVDGNIGWVAAGATPIRDGWDGLLPVPGHTSKYEWRGLRPVAELPQRHNPPEHYIVTANHNILPRDYPHMVSYEWSQPYRYWQLYERLEEPKAFDLDDFKSMQHDSTTIAGRELVDLIRRESVANSIDPECAELMTEWDGVLSTDSRAAVLYGFWLDELLGKFYSLHLKKGQAEFARGRGGPWVMLTELQHPQWLNNSDSPTTRDELLKTTFTAAVARAKQRFPNFPKEGTWGELHTASFTHPLAKLGPEYAAAFSRGPVPKGGDALTPNAATHDKDFRMTNGASYRELFDLSDWDKGLATSTPGQSGQPGSPHYDDLLPLWANEEYFPLAYSRAKVEAVMKNKLLLRPR